MENHAPRVQVETEILNRAGTKKIVESEVAIDAKITAVVHDIKGKTKDTREIPFKSFVSNFPRLLHRVLGSVDNSTSGADLSLLKDIANDTSATSGDSFEVDQTNAEIPGTAGGVLASLWGMVIGDSYDLNPSWTMVENETMGNALAFEDYNIRHRFPTASENQASVHSASYHSSTVTMPDSNTLQVKRSFTNDSATLDAVITEVGLVGKDAIHGVISGRKRRYLIARDDFYDPTLQDPITLEPSDTISITYQFSVTDASGFTKNFLRLISGCFTGGVGAESSVDKDGNSVAPNFAVATLASRCNVMESTATTAASVAYGIQVGGRLSTESVPSPYAWYLSTSSYKLAYELNHSATGLSQGAMNALTLSQVAGEGTKIGFYRDFSNETTNSTYHIYETGLIGRHAITSSEESLLLSRVATPGDGVSYTTILPGEILRVRYYLTFPLGTMGDRQY